MLRPVGFTDEDFKKPVVGIASLWSMVTPCNMHLDQLARDAEAGANAAGGKAVGLTGRDGGLIRARKLKLLDLADFIGIEGTLFITRMGEPSVKVESLPPENGTMQS